MRQTISVSGIDYPINTREGSQSVVIHASSEDRTFFVGEDHVCYNPQYKHFLPTTFTIYGGQRQSEAPYTRKTYQTADEIILASREKETELFVCPSCKLREACISRDLEKLKNWS